MLDDLATLAQILEGALLPLSLIYLAREAQLNVKLTKAQFSHTLTASVTVAQVAASVTLSPTVCTSDTFPQHKTKSS